MVRSGFKTKNLIDSDKAYLQYIWLNLADNFVLLFEHFQSSIFELYYDNVTDWAELGSIK